MHEEAIINEIVRVVEKKKKDNGLIGSPSPTEVPKAFCDYATAYWREADKRGDSTKRGGAAAQGTGLILGTTLGTSGPRISRTSYLHRTFIERAFVMISNLEGMSGFLFSGIQVNINTVMQMHADEKTKGMAVVCIGGDFEGGEFMMRDPDDARPWMSKRIPMQNQAMCFDPKRHHGSAVIRSGFRWSLVFFCHEDLEDFANTDLDDLRALSFRLPRELADRAYFGPPLPSFEGADAQAGRSLRVAYIFPGAEMYSTVREELKRICDDHKVTLVMTEVDLLRGQDVLDDSVWLPTKAKADAG